MWRSLRIITSKTKPRGYSKIPGYLSSTSTSQSGNSGTKTAITVFAATGLGVGVAIAYGKYDPKFRKLVEDNVPYSNVVFKSLPDFEKSNEKVSLPAPAKVDSKSKEVSLESSLLKKKQDRLKKEDVPVVVDKKTEDPKKQKEDKISGSGSTTIEAIKPNIDVSLVIENAVKDLLSKAEKSTTEAIEAQEEAVEAIKQLTMKLYQALDVSGGESNSSWNEVDIAGSKEEMALSIAKQKVTSAQALIEQLKSEIKKGKENGIVNKSLILGEETSNKLGKSLREAEAKVAAAHTQSQTASEYKDLVDKAREQFKKELQIVLPKYSQKSKEKSMTEDELNLLIAHAHRRIEHLQKELARQQVTEKQKIENAKQVQKSEDVDSLEFKIAAEVARQEKKLEAHFEEQLDLIHEEFEADLRHQLRRQAAAHADHLQEALQVQREEMERKHEMDVEEKLLQLKGVFISEISGSMAKLKGIESYLRARARLNEAARKTQALWLACQTMKNTIKSGFSENPKPLGKELAIVKTAAAIESPFVATVLSGIPLQAVERGVYTDEYLKHRFNKVKRICRQVAIVDDNNRSLYRYMLSYLQSFLIVDTPKLFEKDEKLGTRSERDNFDILNEISYSLQRNDMEQALNYAKQLRGEPYNVAKDWISELQLLLEATQAVDCLIAYASAIGVQAYH